VGGVLIPQSEATASVGPRGKKQDVDLKGVCEPKVVGIVDPHPIGKVGHATLDTCKHEMAGRIVLPDLAYPSLPDNAPPVAVRVYSTVIYLFRLRYWSKYPDAPVPLSKWFVSQVSALKLPGAGFSASTAARGVSALAAIGIISPAGMVDCGHGRMGTGYRLNTDVLVNAAPVVTEAIPIPLRIRVELRLYAKALDDTTDQRPYRELKRNRHVFEPYVPGLFACRGMRACAAMIRARLAEDEPVTITPPANIAEAVRERRTYDPGQYLRGCGIALTTLRRRLKAIIAEAGSYRTFEDDMKIAALLRRVALIEHLHAEQCLDNGALYRASPFAQWFESVASSVSPEATARVERNARVPYFSGISYHPVAA